MKTGSIENENFIKKNALKYIEDAKLLFCVVDREKQIRYINKESCTLLGYEKQELIGKNIINVVEKEKRMNMEILLSGIINEDMIGIDGFEIEIMTKEGEKRIIECSAALVYNDNMDVEELILSGSDKTTAKHLEAEREIMLIEMKDRIREMSCLYDISMYMQEKVNFDSGVLDIIKNSFRSSDKVSILIINGQEKYYSQEFKESQYKVRKNLDLKDESHSYIEFYFSTEKIYQKEIVNNFERVEKFIDVLIKAVEVIFRNRKLEEKVQEKMNELKLTQEITRLGTIIYSIENGSVDASYEVYTIFGITKDEEVLGEDKNIFEYLISQLKKGEKTEKRIIKYSKKNGEEIYLSVKGETIYKEQKIYKIIISILEVTDMKKKEMELEKARAEAEAANISKNMFLANMSHELRTPLNSILGFSQLLLRNNSLNIDAVEKVETMIKSGNHLLDIINTILDLAKIEAGKIEIINERFGLKRFFDIIEKIFLYKAIEKKLDINFIFESDIDIDVISDEKRLKQIYINVIGNVVKFTEKGGVTITTTVKNDKNKKIRIETIIKDTGSGMPDNFKEIIFKRFERAENNVCRKEGTGLGLAISKELANLVGGNIEIVDSVVGAGSTFKIYFYSEKIDKIIKEEKEVLDNVGIIVKNRKIKAMVADDSSENRKVLKEILEFAGVECEEAENGAECVKKCKEKEFDVVFTDIVMPEQDGVSAISELRKMDNYKNKLIVAVTASIFKERIEVVFEAGADEVLIKPIEEKIVFSILQKYFEIKEKDNNIDNHSEKEILSKDIVISIKESLINGDIDEIIRICSENKSKYGIIKKIEKFAKEYNFEKIYEIIEKNEKL